MMSSKPARNMYRLFIGMKLKVNSASCWYLLYSYTTVHGPQNIKNVQVLYVHSGLITNGVFEAFLKTGDSKVTAVVGRTEIRSYRIRKKFFILMPSSCPSCFLNAAPAARLLGHP
jgi:hypothetical protein